MELNKRSYSSPSRPLGRSVKVDRFLRTKHKLSIGVAEVGFEGG